MEEKIYLALLHTLWFTQNKLHFIFKDKQNYREFYENISENYLREFWLKDNQIKIILERKNKFSIEFIQKNIIQRNVKIITVFDEDFPQDFHNLSQVPFVIYVRWNINKWQKISIVGSRKISSYWKKIIENFIPILWKYFTIVSGWAAGCDTWAHKISLENNVNTISIIGTGIDQDYPVNNKKIYDEIVEKWGWVLSMFPIGEIWNPYNFPIRNQLVAGISAGTLIVEAKQKSGTLITARLALELWKEVFATPWDIFSSQCEWSNILIQNSSAYPVIQAENILEQFNIISQSEKKIWIWNVQKISFQDDVEEKIYNLLLVEKLNINELWKKLSMDVMTLWFKMSMLEVWGFVKKSLSWDYEIQ